MKHIELYKKYKVKYSSAENPSFTKKSLVIPVLISLSVLLIAPLIMHKAQRHVPLTWDNYFHQMGYFSFVTIPFSALILWANWRENMKRSRGYGWIGKFEVLDKRASIFTYHLLLTPGYGYKIPVSRSLFCKTRVGDLIEVSRNALGNIEEIKRINDIKGRLKRAEVKRFQEITREYQIQES